jgi:hypothetical protein
MHENLDLDPITQLGQLVVIRSVNESAKIHSLPCDENSYHGVQPSQWRVYFSVGSSRHRLRPTADGSSQCASRPHHHLRYSHPHRRVIRLVVALLACMEDAVPHSFHQSSPVSVWGLYGSLPWSRLWIHLRRRVGHPHRPLGELSASVVRINSFCLSWAPFLSPLSPEVCSPVMEA